MIGFVGQVRVLRRVEVRERWDVCFVGALRGVSGFRDCLWTVEGVDEVVLRYFSIRCSTVNNLQLPAVRATRKRGAN